MFSLSSFKRNVYPRFKTLYGFKAINITIGLPFIRITLDHGPNNKMVGKNLSTPTSLIEAINFIKNLRDI